MSGIQIMPSQDYKFLSMVLMFTWVGEDKKVFFPQDNFCITNFRSDLHHDAVFSTPGMTTAKGVPEARPRIYAALGECQNESTTKQKFKFVFQLSVFLYKNI